MKKTSFWPDVFNGAEDVLIFDNKTHILNLLDNSFKAGRDNIWFSKKKKRSWNNKNNKQNGSWHWTLRYAAWLDICLRLYTICDPLGKEKFDFLCDREGRDPSSEEDIYSFTNSL